MIRVSEDFTLMIDYAHNAMSLESLLLTLREYHPERLVCVFGCGGNRSKLRRYEMGKYPAVCRFDSDYIRQSRFEEPQRSLTILRLEMSKPAAGLCRDL